MSKVLGKRKARSAAIGHSANLDDAQALFRQHFESQFKPLHANNPPRLPISSSLDDSEENEDLEQEDEEWGGISEQSDGDLDIATSSVEVVDHTTNNTSGDMSMTMTKREMRAYMSSIPNSTDQPTSARSSSPPSSSEDEDESSAAFLAKDLELQRLLSESKLLATHLPASSTSAAAAFSAGRLRRATTEMRLRALGASAADPAGGRMPMAMRRGIDATAARKEKARRREARESGIVLERSEVAAGAGRRRRGGGGGGGAVDLPGVGRMHGAELRLSARDIRSIESEARRGGERRVGSGGGRGDGKGKGRAAGKKMGSKRRRR